MQALGDGAFFPFLPLHLNNLGIGLKDIELINVTSPIAILFAAPLMGLLADSIANPRKVLIVSLLMTSLVVNAILFVPNVQKVPKCPKSNRTVNLIANQDSYLNVGHNLLMEKSNCSEVNDFNTSMANNQLRMQQFTNCRIICGLILNAKLTSSNYNLDIDLLINTTTFSATISNLNCSNNSVKSSSTAQCPNISDYQLSCPLNHHSINPTIKLIVVDDLDSHQMTFWTYLMLRSLLLLLFTLEINTLITIALQLSRKFETYFAYQQFWSALAAVLVPSVIGLMITINDVDQGDHEEVISMSYTPSFYVFASMKVISALIVCFVDIEVPKSSNEILINGIRQLVTSSEVLIMFMMVTLIGAINGLVETFIGDLFHHLRASRDAIGFSIAISALSEIPCTLIAGPLANCLGHIPVIVIGITCYAIRLIGYSFASHVSHVFALEVIEGLTTSLIFVTITTYANEIAPNGLPTTMQSLWGAAHFALGGAAGSMLGGILVESIGLKTTFHHAAILCVAMATFYLIVYLCCFKKREVLRRKLR